MIKFVKNPHKNLQNPTGPAKTYATAQMNRHVMLDEFAEHISEHNSKYEKGDIEAVINSSVKCLFEFLLNGDKVSLGDLGSFWLVLKSEGVMESVPDEETGEKPVFTAKNINGISVRWYPGKKFASGEFMRKAHFEEVVTRKAERELRKEKNKMLADGTYFEANDNAGGNDEDDVETHE